MSRSPLSISAESFTTQNDRGEWRLLGAHQEVFMPDEDRATIDESIRRSGFVLSASVADEQADEAIECLERSGAVDLDQRAGEWRAAGWPGAAESTSASSTNSSLPATATDTDSARCRSSKSAWLSANARSTGEACELAPTSWRSPSRSRCVCAKSTWRSSVDQ